MHYATNARSWSMCGGRSSDGIENLTENCTSPLRYVAHCATMDSVMSGETKTATTALNPTAPTRRANHSGKLRKVGDREPRRSRRSHEVFACEDVKRQCVLEGITPGRAAKLAGGNRDTWRARLGRKPGRKLPTPRADFFRLMSRHFGEAVWTEILNAARENADFGDVDHAGTWLVLCAIDDHPQVRSGRENRQAQLQKSLSSREIAAVAPIS